MCDNLLFESEDLPVGHHVTVVTTPLPRAKPLRALRRSPSKVQVVDAERSSLVPVDAGEPRNNLEVGPMLRSRSQASPLIASKCGPTPIFDDCGNFVIDAEDLRDDPEVRRFWGRRTQPRRTCKLPKNKKLQKVEIGTQVNLRRDLQKKPEGCIAGEDDKEEDRSVALPTLKCDGIPIKSSWNVMNPKTGKRESKSKRPCLKTRPCRVMQVSHRQTRKLVRGKSQAAKNGEANESTGSKKLVTVNSEVTLRLVRIDTETSEQLKRGKSTKSAIAKTQKKVAKSNAKTSKNKDRVGEIINHSRDVVSGAPDARKKTKKSTGPKFGTKTEQPSSTPLERKLVTREATAPKKPVVPVRNAKKSQKLVQVKSKTLHQSADLIQKESVTSDSEILKGKKKEPSKKARKGCETKIKKAPARRKAQTTGSKTKEGSTVVNHLDLDVCQVLTFKKDVYFRHPQKTRMPRQATIRSTLSISTRRALTAKQVSNPSSTLKPIAIPSTSKTPSTVPAQPSDPKPPQPPTQSVSAQKSLVTKSRINSYSTLVSMSIPSTSKIPSTAPAPTSVGAPSKASRIARLPKSPVRKPKIQKPTSSPMTVGRRRKTKLKKPVVTDSVGECTSQKRPQGRPKLAEGERKIPTPRKKKRAEKSLTCPVCAHQEDYVVLIMRHVGVEHPGVAEYVRRKINSPYDPLWDDMPKVVNGVIVDSGEPIHLNKSLCNETQINRVDSDSNYETSALKTTEALNEAVRKGLHLRGPNMAQAAVFTKTSNARRHLRLAPAEIPTGGCNVPSKSSGPIVLRPPNSSTNYGVCGEPRLSATPTTTNTPTNTYHGTLPMATNQRMQGQRSANATINSIGTAPSTSMGNVPAAASRFVAVELTADQYSAREDGQSDIPTFATASRHAQGSLSAYTEELENVGVTENFLGTCVANAENYYIESPHSSSSAYFSGSGNFVPDARKSNYKNWILNGNPERYISNDNLEVGFEQGDLVNEFPLTRQYTSNRLNPGPTFLSYADGIDFETNHGQRQMSTDVNPGEGRNQLISSLEDELRPYINIGQLPMTAQKDVLFGNYSVGQRNVARSYLALPERSSDTESVTEESLYRRNL